MNGFTLIEVLIALSITAIALTAILKTSGQNIKNTEYLQEKIIAEWVALEKINEIQSDVLALPLNSVIEKTSVQLNKKWQWRGKKESTKNPRIKKISVSVANDRGEERTQLTAFKYEK